VKLLFDQNLSHRLVNALKTEFPDSTHVRDIGLSSAEDIVVWEYAKEFGFAIISKDTDFSQRSFLLGAPPKVLWIRLGNCSTQQIENVLRSYRDDIYDFGSNKESSFLVIDPWMGERTVSSATRQSVGSIQYDPEKKILEIEFRPNGEIYRYFDVPETVYRELHASVSKIEYLRARVIPRYKFQKLL
jgi:predicted nuclease of predicted toxin-antitoxin system